MYPTHRASLLIIDADLAFQSVLRASFHADGHHVLPATSIADAQYALAACAVDLVLVNGDVALGPDGWSGLDSLRAAAGPTPIVILSTVGAVPFAGYRARGFAALLARPGDLDDLRTALAPFLQDRAPRRALPPLATPLAGALAAA